jgi:hypothetical protein
VYPGPVLAVSVAGLFVQIVTGPGGVTTAGGGGITVTVSEVVAVQLFTSVTVTVYVPEEFTFCVADVEVFDHRNDIPPLAVRFTSSPEQNVSGPSGVMTATGRGCTVTVSDAVALQPFASVTMTVNVPEAMTEIFCDDDELDHW